VRWIYRGNLLYRFWVLKDTFLQFFKEKEEFCKERKNVRQNDWQEDTMFSRY